jgi:hypothetical protein
MDATLYRYCTNIARIEHVKRFDVHTSVAMVGVGALDTERVHDKGLCKVFHSDEDRYYGVNS